MYRVGVGIGNKALPPPVGTDQTRKYVSPVYTTPTEAFDNPLSGAASCGETLQAVKESDCSFSSHVTFRHGIAYRQVCGFHRES